MFAVRQFEPGEALGYGAHFVTSRPTRIGLVAIGYADGYPRTAPSSTQVWVMDMLAVDLTGHPDAGIGRPVEL